MRAKIIFFLSFCIIFPMLSMDSDQTDPRVQQLFKAVENDDVSTMEQLLSGPHGLSPLVTRTTIGTDGKSRTWLPLSGALLLNKPQSALTLLKYDPCSQVNQVDASQFLPLEIAVTRGMTTVIPVLVRHGSNISKRALDASQTMVGVPEEQCKKTYTFLMNELLKRAGRQLIEQKGKPHKD